MAQERGDVMRGDERHYGYRREDPVRRARGGLGKFVFLALLVLIGGVGLWSWNGVIGKHEAVGAAWAQVESNMQRRADLVPNLLRSISRFLEHETDMVQTVVEGRRGLYGAVQALQQAHTSANDVMTGSSETLPSPARLGAMARVQGDIGRKIHALIAVTEAYPALRSADQFLRLQAQLEGTENRINIARMRYNEAVRTYNASIRRFPGTLFAEALGFSPLPYFEADAGADEPVRVEFD